MPQFDLKSAHEYWSQFQDPSIYQVVCLMESSEDWTLDGDAELEDAITSLGLILDDMPQMELPDLNKFIEILCSVKLSRMLRILQAIDVCHPGSASKVIQHAEQNMMTHDGSRIFSRRNIIFERLRLMFRIAQPERMKLLKKLLIEDL
ncbi:MAG: type IVB secretion system protein IcmW [Candidatus Comchoanobacterales bacterium]